MKIILAGKIRQIILFALVISFTFISETSSQDEIESKGLFYLAPDLGLMLGSVTRIELAPMIGYYLTNRLTVSAGLRYEYYNYSKKYYGIYGYETSIYGPRAQARYLVIKNIDNIIPLRMNMGIFLQLEQEVLSLQRKYFDFPSYSDDGRFWKPFTLAGGGIRQQAGRNVLFNAAVLWDINNDISSPYNNPVIRIGLQINFRKKNE